ncbi:MAG: hypothetical protein AVDCRST_MAG89-3171 [uncultured Gemmatimonadetes bacterium]|uniref:Uncharacterized protein n=1 Tax=uncultured Gemmatimonadota bacterium TaxID=203437 RepID=A0A6J4M7G0_9BACT|nr:MAG: hypothetical protein AVDCRST_MAG89-3171 [uncultured Gemmatimonadota bacterium]
MFFLFSYAGFLLVIAAILEFILLLVRRVTARRGTGYLVCASLVRAICYMPAGVMVGHGGLLAPLPAAALFGPVAWPGGMVAAIICFLLFVAVSLGGSLFARALRAERDALVGDA